MRDSTVELAGQAVVKEGKLVDPKLRVERVWR
jgi:hypothetical protein